MQAEIYNMASNFAQDCGVTIGRAGDNNGVQLAGATAGNQGITSRDSARSSNFNRQSWVQDPNAPYASPVVVQVDYGYTTPGKFSTTIRGAIGSSYPLIWRPSLNGQDVHPTDNYNIIRVGAVPSPTSGGPWGQIQVDNIRLQYIVPEPRSVLALGSGLVGLLGMIRHRK